MSELFVHNPNPKKAYSPRKKNDFYPTPYGCALASVRWLKTTYGINPSIILDPGAGTGVWGKACREVFSIDNINPFIVGVELDKAHADNRVADNDWQGYNQWVTEDYLEYTPYRCDGFDLIVGNPPYSKADEFINKSMTLVRKNNSKKLWIIAFLLKLSYLGSQYRGKELFVKNPPLEVVAYSRRPSFSGDGKTDGCEYGFFIWSNYNEWLRWYMDVYMEEGTHLNWLDWDYHPEDFKNKELKGGIR